MIRIIIRIIKLFMNNNILKILRIIYMYIKKRKNNEAVFLPYRDARHAPVMRDKAVQIL